MGGKGKSDMQSGSLSWRETDVLIVNEGEEGRQRENEIDIYIERERGRER